MADTLVGALPGLRLVATSREALGVPGEVLVPVGTGPPAAVELFVDRARAVRPGFTADEHTHTVVNDIVAGWTAFPWPSSSPPPAFVHLRWPRWRRSSTTASVCSPEAPAPLCPATKPFERWWAGATTCCSKTNAACSRLSVFAGGCDLEAAEAVCADERVPTAEILDVLSRLVDKSLASAPDAGGDARFSQLQTLWQYGRERLSESGELEAVCGRHGAHYQQMAEGPRRPARSPAGALGRSGGNASPRTWATCGPRSTGSSPQRTPMRRCRWRREWWGCGSSTVTLSKERAGLVTRSGPGGRAVLNWKRPPGSGTAISCAWHSAPRSGARL